jgi:hypothetical protein
VGGLYAPRLSALGGIPPYHWSATGLIGGLKLDSTTGELSGTAKTGNGATNITFKVTDAVGNSASSTLPVQVYPAPVVASFVRQAELGMPFSYTPPPPSPGTAGPYQWSAFGKPTWLSLNTATGALTGTPRSRDGDKSEFFALQAADAYGSLSAPVAEEIDVNRALVMRPFDASSFTGGIVGAPYFTEPNRAFYNGTAPITFSITGALPPGLNVNCTVDCFQISGVPTTAGAYPVTVRATDALGASLAQARTIYIGSCPIGEAPSIKGAVCLQAAFAPAGGVLPMATTGVPYSATVSVPGGAAPFQASEDTSSFGQGLLAGLSLTADNAGNITIFGTPNLGASYGNFSFVLRVNDSATPNQTAAEALYTIPVAGPTGGTSACTTGAVMPAVLSNGDVGAAYPATQMTVPGCTPNVQTWSATGLPAGLGITPTGALSGTPTLAGTYNFTITGSDPNQKTWTRSYSIKIGGAFAQNSSFSPTTYASTVNTFFYLPTIGVPTNNGVATGGLGPYVYRLSPGNFLPPNLTLGETAGSLYGTVDSPCFGNSCGFSIDVTDAAGQTVRSVQLTLTTAVAPINPYTRYAALPVANQPYYDVVVATGGVPVFFPGYTFTMTNGALPTGLYLAPDGVIYGTPTVPLEQYSFDVTATDSMNNTGTLTLSGTVSDLALATNPSALPPGEAGVNYHFQMAATGGSGSFYWNGFSNRCEAAGRKGNYGLPKYGCGGPYFLDYSKGVFTGNVAIGYVGVTWQPVSLYDQQTNAHIDTYFPIIIGLPLGIGTQALPPTSQGGGYAAQLAASGGAGPYTWSATGLPSGFTLSPEGNLTGSAAAAGTFPVTFTVTDSANQNADPALPLPAPITKVLNIVVYGPVTINTTALPSGSTGHAYSLAVLADGGGGGNSWSASNLPSGLSMDPASGTIQGTPTAAQARMVYLTVTDKYGSSTTVALPLTISP